MFLRKVLLFLISASISVSLFAQKKEDFKQPRILILLDGSSSMVNEWAPGQQRFQAAGDIILRLMDSIYRLNPDVEFSLRLYGHQSGVPDNNCFDTRREVMFSKNNYTQMSLRLASLRPIGVSPIAYSLKMAAETDFTSERDYAYSLVLITDGGESCGGNICDVVKTLLDKKIEFKPYIISLVDYAPLKDMYACLGNYLLAANPTDVAPTIHTIADAYRKVLAVPIAKPKLVATPDKPAPTAPKMAVPPVNVKIADPETTAVVKQPELKVPEPPKPQVVAAPKPEPAPTPVPAPARNADPTPSKIKVDTAPFPREKIAAVSTRRMKLITYNLGWEITKLKRRPVQRFPLPPVEATAAQPPRPTVVKPIAPTRPEPKIASYTVKLEPAAETLLEVYFTDGKGKFYSSTPPMKLLDAATGAEVKKFYRTVDAAGNPDPQTVAPGNYVLLMGKTGNYKTKNITIQAANKNKIEVVVTRGTLTFRYDDNPQRPPSEFMASVRKTFEAGTNVVQKCTDEREYEPGNYHIEINTLPMMIRNIDLDFGWSYTIDIPEPGFVQFENTNRIGKISLWTPLGDQFARFYNMEIPGNPAAQNLRLLPGVYEVHWKRNPSLPNEPDVIQKFSVKSNNTTYVTLQ